MVHTEEPLSKVGKRLVPEGIEGNWQGGKDVSEEFQMLSISKTDQGTLLIESKSDLDTFTFEGIAFEIDGKHYLEPLIETLTDGKEKPAADYSGSPLLAYRIHLQKDELYFAVPDYLAICSMIGEKNGIAGHKSSNRVTITTRAAELAEWLGAHTKQVYKKPIRLTRAKNNQGE